REEIHAGAGFANRATCASARPKIFLGHAPGVKQCRRWTIQTTAGHRRPGACAAGGPAAGSPPDLCWKLSSSRCRNILLWKRVNAELNFVLGEVQRDAHAFINGGADEAQAGDVLQAQQR